MDSLSLTKSKIDAILDKILALKAGDFPQEDSRDALNEIENILREHRETLESLDRDVNEDVAAAYCNSALGDLFTYLPILGFLHRSKSASNAFELYGPLRRLAQTLMGNETKLIMASEWDFSPYTLLQMPGLPSYVLIGMPASEAGNALLTPLAGHEFGHSIWQLEKVALRYERTLAKSIEIAIKKRWQEYRQYFPHVDDETTLLTDMFAVQTWYSALRWALRQCEEIYCDFTGLRLFGDAYLSAFAYLLAPGMDDQRIPFYPSVIQRVDYLKRAAVSYGVDISPGYDTLFRRGNAPPNPGRETFLQELSDEAVRDQISRLIANVEQYAVGRGISLSSHSEARTILNRFKLLVPPDDPASLSAIVNAGWQASDDDSLWTAYPQLKDRRGRVLNELMLKSAQILEVRQRLADPVDVESRSPA